MGNFCIRFCEFRVDSAFFLQFAESTPFRHCEILRSRIVAIHI
ncbi:hypothetical protein [Helicobacter sp. 23-1045]